MSPCRRYRLCRRRPRRGLTEPLRQFVPDGRIIEAILPPPLDKVGNITLRRQLRKANNLDLFGNAIQCGANYCLVLLALLVIVAENEDAPVLEVWRQLRPPFPFAAVIAGGGESKRTEIINILLAASD